jgi:hypothetical protein
MPECCMVSCPPQRTNPSRTITQPHTTPAGRSIIPWLTTIIIVELIRSSCGETDTRYSIKAG